jgi:drug/metabolite transporter (DMT)-like permease
MIAGGFAFFLASLLNNEWSGFRWQSVSIQSWVSLLYLILLGSIAAYSAYVWLLQVRPATQVSTYAYVNPVVAILLGAFVANEKITLLQVGGLAIILTSVLLINLAKHRREKQSAGDTKSYERKKPGMTLAKKQPVCNA